jgi:ketosteroid isomerase-like protein
MREADSTGDCLPTNKQIIQGAYKAFAEGDVLKLLALMDEKIDWTEAEGFSLHGTSVGPQAVVDGVFMRLGEIGDEFTVTPTRFVAEDDTVVATGTYSWKHRSTGQPALVQMAHVWTFRDPRSSRYSSTSTRSRCRSCQSEWTVGNRR